ncbi:hypothetical protein C7293_25715 [filamentous cyanobacterium CCT1]|nr:hypothetical protein C7293_25715 [filamentous cyanobacterium CCT1]PSN81175.1 hypothetical protein C8B47_02835 [filamentous cyanobacterium CCP4]
MAKKSTITHAKKAFKHQFNAMVPLILSEWPQLIEENLLATEGDLERAVNYISGEIDHTKTLVRRHLNELASLIEPVRAIPEAISSTASLGSDSKAASLVSKIQDAVPDQVSEFLEDRLSAASSSSENGISAKISTVLEETVPSTVDQLLNDLESRTERLIAELKAEMLPELEKKARSNLGTSLLIALGLGFILGLRLGGKRD